MTAERQPPRLGNYPEAGLYLERWEGEYYPSLTFRYRYKSSVGITAEQAREAAHLLNQLAEYLECKPR